MRQQDDFHLHRVSRLAVRVLGLADVLAGVREDGFVDAILAPDHVRPRPVKNPVDPRFRNAVGVAEKSQAVAVEDDLGSML